MHRVCAAEEKLEEARVHLVSPCASVHTCTLHDVPRFQKPCTGGCTVDWLLAAFGAAECVHASITHAQREKTKQKWLYSRGKSEYIDLTDEVTSLLHVDAACLVARCMRLLLAAGLSVAFLLLVVPTHACSRGAQEARQLKKCFDGLDRSSEGGRE